MKKIVTLSVAACMAVMLFAGCGKDAASSAPAASEAGVSAAAAETTEAAAPEVSEAPAEEALDQAVLGTWKFSEVAVDGDARMALDEYAEAESLAEESGDYKSLVMERLVFAADGVFYDAVYEDYLSDYQVYDGYTWEIRGDTIYVVPKSDGQSAEEKPHLTITLNQGELKVTNGSVTAWMVKESDSQTPPESLK